MDRSIQHNEAFIGKPCRGDTRQRDKGLVQALRIFRGHSGNTGYFRSKNRVSRYIAVSLAAVILFGAALFVPKVFGNDSVPAVASNEVQEGTPVVILMYHSIVKDKKATGKYVVTPDELKSDIIYLKEHGYEMITASDLVSYTEGECELPEKPVMLSFDDGYFNNYLYALPLLREYDAKAVIAVIGECCEQYEAVNDENPAYAYLTWKRISELADTGIVEIANHSFSMHHIKENGRRGSAKKKGESSDKYKKTFEEDTLKLQQMLKEHSGVTPVTYVYPYGEVSRETKDYLEEMGFCASMTCYEGVNYITQDPECLFNLKRYIRPGGKPTEKYFKSINLA